MCNANYKGERGVMEEQFKEYIEDFREKGPMYWLFSKSDNAAWARSRNEVPVEIVHGCTKEEAAEICAKIRSRLAEKDFKYVYIKILVYFNDVIALELLKELRKHYKERRRALKREGMDCWKHELAMIKDAIHHLKRVK